MLIDTHAHLNFNAYRNDAEEVIKRTLKNKIWMINVGSKYETSKRAVEMTQKYPDGVFTAVGLHPLHLATDLVKIKNDTEEVAELRSSPVPRYARPSEIKTKEENFDYGKHKELAQNSKVIAIGEVGLDYYWKPKTKNKLELFKEKQRAGLCQQLKLAEELNLPVIFHCRMAHKDLIQFLKENEEIRPKNAVAHGFVGNSDELKQYLNFGYCIGFNGIIFKKIEGIDFEENIKAVPLDKILIETDCPYLTPPQVEGRNEPLYVKYIAEKIAKIKDISFEKIAEITTRNAKNLFKI